MKQYKIQNQSQKNSHSCVPLRGSNKSTNREKAREKAHKF